jgi:nucleoside-diphosphate-sugar epimerase
MTVIIIGAMGNIGRRLMPAFPGAIGIDRVTGADIVANLATLDYDDPQVKAAFAKADGVIHVATSADARDPDQLHWQAVVGAARLLEACDRFGMRRVVIPSSDWADPKTRWAEHELDIYGHSKRVFEAMAHMYNIGHPDRHCVALRIGWVPHSADDVPNAAAWLQANYWDDARLIAQMKSALGD